MHFVLIKRKKKKNKLRFNAAASSTFKYSNLSAPALAIDNSLWDQLFALALDKQLCLVFSISITCVAYRCFASLIKRKQFVSVYYC